MQRNEFDVSSTVSMAQGRSLSGRSLYREIRYNEFRYSERSLFNSDFKENPRPERKEKETEMHTKRTEIRFC
jgi:hypothetical protein